MRSSHATSILVCLLAGVGTTHVESTARAERQEYHSAPDWLKPPLQWALVANSEGTIPSDALPLLKEPLPLEVAPSIHNIVGDCYRGYIETNEGGGGYLPMARFYGPVFRFKTPDARTLYAFTVYERGHCVESEKWYYFLLFDPDSRKVTKHCPSVQAKHMESALFCGPLVHFFDVNLDGQTELVIQEIVRNGTMYDAAIYYYYRVTEDVDFVPLLALEARVVDLFSDERGLIVRTLDCLGSNQLQVNVALEDPAGTPHHQELGTILLKAKDSTSPFEVVQKNIRVSRYADCLLTASGIEDRSFLREGYRARRGERKATEGNQVNP
jgi:hypothetical protein